ncbi:uncharacterized protein [Narcine bancroftii]|uniref:uncharacterized protein isoform X2 n=1 Tax=Narcine bancroftii TaxID=1343680 RepID=UPI0038315D4D
MGRLSAAFRGPRGGRRPPPADALALRHRSHPPTPTLRRRHLPAPAHVIRLPHRVPPLPPRHWSADVTETGRPSWCADWPRAHDTHTLLPFGNQQLLPHQASRIAFGWTFEIPLLKIYLQGAALKDGTEKQRILEDPYHPAHSTFETPSSRKRPGRISTYQ